MRRTIKRRRKEHKTDYSKRIKLLKSGLPRVILRKTNRYLIAQYVTSKEAQDKIGIGITSKELLKHGWPKKFEHSLKSIPAAYLTGYLFGKMISTKDTPIVDFGMMRAIQKNKMFAFIKGLKDAGVKVNCDEESFPSEDRIKGKHLKEDFSKEFEAIRNNIGGKK